MSQAGKSKKACQGEKKPSGKSPSYCWQEQPSNLSLKLSRAYIKGSLICLLHRSTLAELKNPKQDWSWFASGSEIHGWKFWKVGQTEKARKVPNSTISHFHTFPNEGGHEVHQIYAQPEGDLIFLLVFHYIFQHVIAKLVLLLQGLQVLITHLSPGSFLT